MMILESETKQSNLCQLFAGSWDFDATPSQKEKIGKESEHTKQKKQCKKTMKEKTKTIIHVKDELHNDQSHTSKVLLKQPNQ